LLAGPIDGRQDFWSAWPPAHLTCAKFRDMR
jgi:hypothetical protein